jgi:hypothetical protein
MVMHRCCNKGAVYRETILNTCPYSSPVLPTRTIREKQAENQVKCGCPRASSKFYNRSIYILTCFEKCNIFKEYYHKISPVKEDLPNKDCEEITKNYVVAIEEIKQSTNTFMKDYLEQHVKLIEDRKDFSECAKAARRKILVHMWHRIKENGNSMA